MAKLHTPRLNPTTWFAIASIPMIVGAAFFTIAVSEVQIEKSHPVLIDNVWCRLGILLLALGGVAAVFGVIGGLARWRDESITPFKLSLDGGECVQFRPNFNDHQVRVNLTNKSSLGVVDVRVKIRDRDPGGYSHYLAQMHDANGVLSLGGDDLAPGDSLFVDVASTRAGASDFAFSFAAPHLWGLEVNSVPLHTFTLVARGRFEETRRSVKAGRGRFQLTFTHWGWKSAGSVSDRLSQTYLPRSTAPPRTPSVECWWSAPKRRVGGAGFRCPISPGVFPASNVAWCESGLTATPPPVDCSVILATYGLTGDN